MTQHTAAIVIVAVMAAGVMVTATTAAVAAVKALRDYMKERTRRMRHGLIQEVTEAIENELSAANKAFPGFNSTHEGYAVILEEAQETEDEMRKTGMNLNALWQATRMNQSPKQIREIAEAIRESARDMAAEAIQTAAMAEKLIQYTERQEG